MNIIENKTEAPVSSTPKKSSRFRRFIALILVAVGLTTGATVAVAAPAQAAPASGYITVCFTNSVVQNGRVFTTPSNNTIRYHVWWQNQDIYWTAYLNSRGCTNINVFAGAYWRFEVDDYEGGYRYSGGTNWAWVYANQTVNFGTVPLLTTRA